MFNAGERLASEPVFETEKPHARARLSAAIGGFLLSGVAVYAGYKGGVHNAEAADVSLLVGGQLGFVAALKLGIPAVFDISDGRGRVKKQRQPDPLFRPGDGTAMYEISRRNHEEMLAERALSDPVQDAMELERRAHQEMMDAMLSQYAEYWDKLGREVDDITGDLPERHSQDDL